MLGYLIYTKYEAERNEKFINILFDASKKYGVELKLLYSEDISFNVVDGIENILLDNIILKKPDFVIQRTMNCILSMKLENMGIRVFNRKEISENFDNKYNAYSKIKNLSIPVLDTYIKNKIDTENLFFPNVTKPIDSKGGDRVFYNKDIVDYNESIKKYDNEFILQKPSKDIGKDLRVYVIGKEIIVSILRISKSGFLSNFTKGNDIKLYTLNEKEKCTVEKIITSFDFDYVGIDFLFNDYGLVFSEIENVVGARMVYTLTDINIGELFIKHICREMQNN